MDIRKIEIEDRRWQTLVDETARGCIFHHSAWLQVIALSYGYRPFALAVFDGGQLVGGIPFMEIDSFLTGKRWVAVPFSDHCPPLVRDAAALQLLIEDLQRERRSEELKSVEIKWALPENGNIHRSRKLVMHCLQLPKEPQQAFERMSKTAQRNVNKARACGVTVDFVSTDKAVDSFYRLHVMTRKRQGVPVQPRKFFDRLKTHIVDKGLGFVGLASKDKVPVAAFVILKYKKTLTYKYGASDAGYLEFRPNNILFWNLMEWGCRNGFEALDLGKTEPENRGLRDFKVHLGAEEKELFYSYFADNRAIQEKRDRMSERVLKLAIRTFPAFVCRTSGEILYKHFG